MLLIGMGSMTVAIGYHNRKLRRHHDNPVIELFCGSRAYTRRCRRFSNRVQNPVALSGVSYRAVVGALF